MRERQSAYGIVKICFVFVCEILRNVRERNVQLTVLGIFVEVKGNRYMIGVEFIFIRSFGVGLGFAISSFLQIGIFVTNLFVLVIRLFGRLFIYFTR